MKRSKRYLFVGLLTAAIAAAGLASSPVIAKIKPRNGDYVQEWNNGTAAAIQTDRGRIWHIGVALRFKLPNGTPCSPGSLPSYDGVVVLDPALPNTTIGLNRRSGFRFTEIRRKGFSPFLKINVSGRFLSRNKAKIYVKASEGTCKAHLSGKRLRFQ